ncbi:MAG: hypothetical protein AAF517_18860, partial [Planctomycetota bacterium]
MHRKIALLFTVLCTWPISAHDDDAKRGPQTRRTREPGLVVTDRSGAKSIPLPKERDVFHFVIYGDRTGGTSAGIPILEQAVRDTNLLDPDL